MAFVNYSVKIHECSKSLLKASTYGIPTTYFVERLFVERKLISFVIPAYNEEECIEKLHAALSILCNKIKTKYDSEIVIVENGSQDLTFEKLNKIRSVDPRVKILKLSRNFGIEGGVTAGLHLAKGDAAVIMCADLEDPPEVVLEFIKKWEEGYQNVYGVVRRRQGTLLRRINSNIFYYILSKLTAGLIPRSVSDFRLIDRKVYKSVNSMGERARMLRGIVAWVGFKSVGVEFDRGNRVGGESKASTVVVLRLALRGIFAFSYIPLKLATVLGVIISAVSFTALTIYVVKFLFFGVPFDGFGTIVSLTLMLFGFIFIILGIISEYIAMIFEEVKMRPNYIIEEAIGFEKTDKCSGG